jgi:hypothetical protein
MNDEQLLQDLGSWLKDTDTARPDAERITARAMTQVPQVRQRGRWWPLPALDRESRPALASGSALFSALRFVTAGIIIGLFGGFLLAGVLITPQGDTSIPAAVTDSPSPMTTDRLLSIAQTREVEPGVLQIIDDGVRDLAAADAISLVSGRDGGIWLLADDRFLRVGSDATYEWPPGQADIVSEFEVAHDGTVWTVQAGEDDLSIVRSFDGERWIPHGPALDTRAIEIAPDDTVWAFWQDQGSETLSLGYLAGGDRQPVAAWPESQLHGGELFLTGTGEVWVSGAPEYRVGKPELYRLVDGTLQQEFAATMVAADVGADGTAWFVSLDELIRLDGAVEGAEPEAWALSDAMTDAWGSTSGWTFLPGDAFRAAPDGSVWFALRSDSGPPVPEVHCGGIAGFDGTTWLGPFLPDLCVESIDLAADGSVWLLAHAVDGSDPVDLFVVTPEAASAS